MLTYQLDRQAGDPLYAQLYRGVRNDIESGALLAGQRLPSKRSLANHLGLSVITVEGAYAQLVAEGYIEARPRCGFFVCAGGESGILRCRESTAHGGGVGGASKLRRHCAEGGVAFAGEGRNEPCDEVSFPIDAGIGRAENRLGAGTENRFGTGAVLNDITTIGACPSAVEKQACANGELLADLTGAAAPAGLFPYAAWARTMRRMLSDGSEEALLSSGDGRGTWQLRRAIANHLRGFRGMEVNPEQIVIGSGAQTLYGLLVQLLGRQRVFAIENPGYPRLARIYESNDVPLRFVGLDEKGPLPDSLAATGASVFHCMPSHQFPTGVTTAVARRRQLLEWAAAPAPDGLRRYLIEDDFDCEFRMSGRPVPPLQALDEAESVIYANTFTKTLGAAFRIGYMVLPPHLTEQFRRRLGFYACTVGALEQLTLARFIESGEYERHVNRQRAHFRKLQHAFAAALAEADGVGRLRLVNLGVGLHFVMEVAKGPDDLERSRAIGTPATDAPNAWNAAAPGVSNMRDAAEAEEAIAARAAQFGVLLAPMSRYCFGTDSAAGQDGRSAGAGAFGKFGGPACAEEEPSGGIRRTSRAKALRSEAVSAARRRQFSALVAQRPPSFLVNCTALAPEAIVPTVNAIVRAVEEAD
ncbi:PLP-dependent aminotransferase family protein [Parvibacter caecicola]